MIINNVSSWWEDKILFNTSAFKDFTKEMKLYIEIIEKSEENS